MIRFPDYRRPSFQKSANPLRSLKSRTENSSGNEIWLLTLSDLLMLLMIFFVFLLAAPLVSAGKSATAVHVLKPASAKQPINTLPLPDQRETTSPVSAVNQATDASEKQAAALEQDLGRELGSLENPQGVTIERRAERLVITFPEQILFDSGQARLKAAAGPTLEKVAAFILHHPELSVEVQGHTDDRPIRSARYPSNWELSADRAVSVAKILVGLGVSPQQIATRGFGEYHPVVPNESDAGRLKNRRVEIQFSLLQS